MDERYLGTFSGMDGVKKSQKGPMVGSVSAAVNAIDSYRICSAAGDDGSITVWRDDNGVLRAAFCRFMAVRDKQEFRSKAALRRWLRDWWPAMAHIEKSPVGDRP